MKLISFSIWGRDELYTNGMIANVEAAKVIYPDWVCRVYHDNRVTPYCIDKLRELGAETVLMKIKHSWDGLIWRFLPAGEANVDVVIVRDADSRVNSREKACVDEWLKSDKCFHCMRDHYEHNVAIMGGMWGIKKGCISKFSERLFRASGAKKGDDQEFLAKFIWPVVREKAIVHDRYYQNILIVNSKIITWDQVVYYNDKENCGHKDSGPYGEPSLYDENFPHGKIILKDGTILDRDKIYEYIPYKNFGEHDIRPFPKHQPIEYGTYVGEIIR